MDDNYDPDLNSLIQRMQRADTPDDIDWDAVREQVQNLVDGVDDAGANVSSSSMLKAVVAVVSSLAVTGTASGWSKIQPRKQGTSDVDADTVDGATAAELGRVAKRDRTGSVMFTNVGAGQTTATTANPTATTQITDTGTVLIDKLQASIVTGGGQITLLRNGTNLTTITEPTGSTTYTGYLTQAVTSPTWTLRAQTLEDTTLSQTTKTTTLTTVNEGTTASTITFGSGNSVAATMSFAHTGTLNAANGKILVSSDTKTSDTVNSGESTTINITTTPGTRVTFRVTAGSSGFTDASATMSTRTAKLYGSASTVTGQLSVEKNEFITLT